MFGTELLKNRHVLVGVTGGIAAYKSAELIRYLVTQGAEVQVVMSKAAEHFISRLTLETLSQNPVGVETFPESGFSGTHHIHLADWADAAIVAPASYNFIGKIAHGIADDLITTIFAAIHAPVVIAPAMNVNMWNNPVLQNNLANLENLGYIICPPEEGFLAEGYEGKGRLAPLHHLIQDIYRAIHPSAESLAGSSVLITAGRTEEPIDPVRYISNRSSGKMGYCLAWEAYARGAEVTLISGPNHLPLPHSMKVVTVNTAEQMYQEVKQHMDNLDIFIGAAAVSDYAPKTVSPHKIKKSTSARAMELKPNKDILQLVSEQRKSGQMIVGFAIETKDTEKNALKKLSDKKLDAIVLNNPFDEAAGFDKDTNEVSLFHKNGKSQKLPPLLKLDVASRIFDFILEKTKTKK
jgi:phosphopantothenoylcysteine decarboxylase/phosphopantothenate--cysteine ligase